jgi:1-acyl-sn-glycerol-3-phosphate acyltransferase
MRVRGRENVPAGAAVLAVNHNSYADPVLAWAVTPRHSSYMARADLYHSALARWAFPLLGTIPLRRGQADRDALTAAAALLERGELLGIFPEGTRHNEGIGEGLGGAAFIALRSNVPVVPVGVAGSKRIRPKGVRLIRIPRIAVVFAEPVDPADYNQSTRKERMTAMTEEIMRRIRLALEQAEEARR